MNYFERTECIEEGNPQSLTVEVNQFIFDNSDGITDPKITWTHVVFCGHITFIAYITFTTFEGAFEQ